jgi:prefoldin alpha subunit
MAEKSSEKNKENQMKEILVNLKYLESQIATVHAQLQVLERGLIEIGTTKISLDSIKDLKKDVSSLYPLGSGMFAKGTLAKQDHLLVDVGAGAIIEKDITDAEKILQSREADIRTNITNYQNLLANLEKQYNDLAEKARSLTG